MARLLENDALALLAGGGLNVPAWRVASSPEGVATAVAELGGRAVVKALIPIGGRGKAGAVRIVDGAGSARHFAATLLGKTVLNFPVTELLVSQVVEVAQELFVSFAFDAEACGPVLLFSALGGVDVEDVAVRDESALIRHAIDIRRGLRLFEARELAFAAGIGGKAQSGVAEALVKLWQLFARTEAETVEVNPLVLTPGGAVEAPTGVIVTDDQAAWRHPELSDVADPRRTNGYRPLTEIERTIAAINDLPARSEIRFNELDGDIGFVFLGGGAGYYVFDAVLRHGGRPANTMDGTSSPHDEESMYLATRALLRKRGLKGLIAASNYGNFRPIDARARGVVKALKEASIDPKRFPVVMRFDGDKLAEAKAAAATLPGIDYYDGSKSLEDAARRIVARVRAL